MPIAHLLTKYSKFLPNNYYLFKYYDVEKGYIVYFITYNLSSDFEIRYGDIDCCSENSIVGRLECCYYFHTDKNISYFELDNDSKYYQFQTAINNKPLLVISDLYVNINHRGKKLGSTLMTVACKEAYNNDIHHVSLQDASDGGTIYKRLGLEYLCRNDNDMIGLTQDAYYNYRNIYINNRLT